MNDVKINSNSIEEIYVKYYSSLKRHCIKLVSYNPRFVSIAEDCVQEAFYRAVCHADDFASSPNQYGWLATCCTHYMLSHIRKTKKREKIIGKSVSLEAYGDVPDLMDNILAWIAHTDYQETIEEFMATLSPLEQKIFRAYYTAQPSVMLHQFSVQFSLLAEEKLFPVSKRFTLQSSKQYTPVNT